MATKTTGREELLARAAAVIPNGVSSGGRATFHEVIVRTEGAYVWNAEGKHYVDYREAGGTDLERHDRFRQAMLEEGILEPPFPSPDKRLCVALSETDVDETVEAASRALATVG